jgi:hypothetical protein
MDPLKEFAGFAESLISRLAEQLATINPSVFAIIFVALCLFAVISMRLVAILGAVLLAGLGFLLLSAPNSATTVIALGASTGSLLVTIGGIRSRRREKTQQRDIEILKHSVQNLESRAERHFLQSLNPRSGDVAETEKHNDVL